MEPDPLREIRDIRRQISRECGDEPEKVFAFYTSQQEKMKASGKFRFIARPLDRRSPSVFTEQCDEPKSRG